MRLFGMARLACGVVENDRHDALTYEGGRPPATGPFINAISWAFRRLHSGLD
jgi:hypothetical protein